MEVYNLLLLISPINTEEALESIEGGADIVDVKNPKEGSLGANFPWVIKSIRDMTPKDTLVSATLGDVPYKPAQYHLQPLVLQFLEQITSKLDCMVQKTTMKHLKL